MRSLVWGVAGHHARRRQDVEDIVAERADVFPAGVVFEREIVFAVGADFDARIGVFAAQHAERHQTAVVIDVLPAAVAADETLVFDDSPDLIAFFAKGANDRFHNLSIRGVGAENY